MGRPGVGLRFVHMKLFPQQNCYIDRSKLKPSFCCVFILILWIVPRCLGAPTTKGPDVYASRTTCKKYCDRLSEDIMKEVWKCFELSDPGPDGYKCCPKDQGLESKECKEDAAEDTDPADVEEEGYEYEDDFGELVPPSFMEEFLADVKKNKKDAETEEKCEKKCKPKFVREYVKNIKNKHEMYIHEFICGRLRNTGDREVWRCCPGLQVTHPLYTSMKLECDIVPSEDVEGLNFFLEDPCISGPCKNAGTCQPIIDQSSVVQQKAKRYEGFKCYCLPFATGQTCEDKVKSLKKSCKAACSSKRGRCVNSPVKGQDYYTRYVVEGAREVEDRHSLVNELFGINSKTSHMRRFADGEWCVCKPGYSSYNCKIGCSKGYWGSYCFYRCESGCRTAGCKKRTGECKCRKGYSGKRCQKPVCNTKICRPSWGKCVVQVILPLGSGTYPKCKCNSGRTGEWCQFKLKPKQLTKISGTAKMSQENTGYINPALSAEICSDLRLSVQQTAGSISRPQVAEDALDYIHHCESCMSTVCTLEEIEEQERRRRMMLQASADDDAGTNIQVDYTVDFPEEIGSKDELKDVVRNVMEKTSETFESKVIPGLKVDKNSIKLFEAKTIRIEDQPQDGSFQSPLLISVLVVFGALSVIAVVTVGLRIRMNNQLAAAGPKRRKQTGVIKSHTNHMTTDWQMSQVYGRSGSFDKHRRQSPTFSGGRQSSIRNHSNSKQDIRSS